MMLYCAMVPIRQEAFVRREYIRCHHTDLDDQIRELFSALTEAEKREFIQAFASAVEARSSRASSQDQHGEEDL